jgi:protoporphyrinogen oxidase
MTPLVNTEVPMSKAMLDALTLHETFCVASGIETVTHESVCEFLSQRFGEQVANKFKSEYLY